jgi:CRP-like cAMP-binding protein
MEEDNKDILLKPLFQMLGAIKPISADLRLALLSAFKIANFKRGDIILKECEVCRNLWFLVDGILRSYHTIDEKEVTSRLMFKNHIVISAGSFFKQTPATESIEALSDTVVATLSFISLQEVYNRFPEFNYHTRIITETYFHKQEQRLYMLRQADVRLRYKYFKENYSEYFKDISLKYVASFLNITRETLSRLRNADK